jgi:anti-anti-sigma regulatory factor
VNVRLEGSWTVERAGELKDLLTEAISTDAVEVDFTGVDEVDLSFFQLLHATQKGCAHDGIAIRLLPTLNPAFKAQADWCGLGGITSQD